MKAPQHQCGAKVFGSTIETPQSQQRAQVCVDVKSCLKEDSEGNCQGAWGYCVREKNIWRFNGDECPSRFNTCQAFGNVSYLKNTLIIGNCDSNNAGCLWYSKSKTTLGDWDIDEKIYFNKNVQKCSAENEGCHEFIQLSNIKDNLTNAEVLGDILNDTNKEKKYSDYAAVNKIYLNKNGLKCDATNAGCEKYTPTNGEPWVPGVVKTENLCPQECVGYKNYHQLATNFEAGNQNIYLIPNGQQCLANEAGCDEFTNLDEVTKGGEGKEYYSYLRRCVKTNASCGVFYTWVGSDTQGFQLKSYNLEKNEKGEPKTIGASVNLDNCDSEADAINNPECKQFYDEAGEVYYEFYKNTITCSEDCHPLRNANIIEANCEVYNGTWNNNQCIFMAIPKEGVMCSASNNGCRAYRENHGDNIRIILQDNFEDKEYSGWDNAEISVEANIIGGNSIKPINKQQSIQSSEGVMSDLLIQNKSYEISFWAKSVENNKENVKVSFNNGSMPLSFGAQEIGTDWNKYTFGPLLFSRAVDTNEQLEILGNIFVSNIILKEITNNIFLIKDSWSIPVTCDQTLIGDDSSQEMLNCEEYQDRRGAMHYLKSFSSVCKEKFIGCQTLIDTQNSTSSYGQTTEGVIASSDEIAYFVNDPQNYCLAEEKGCGFFGLPNLNASGGIKKDKEEKEIWQDVYLKNDPDFYSTTLCNVAGMSCQEYHYGENNDSVMYFKDPKDKVCDYKLVLGQTEYGWYKKGTESGLPDCEGEDTKDWVKNCSVNYSGCTQFIDPLSNQSFYYLNNDKIDKNSPNGLVSKKEGNILFNDTSKKELIYNAEETYKKSEGEGKGVIPNTECNSPTCFVGDALIDPLPAGCKADLIIKCTANSIIKVNRDRVCGQWLSCKDSSETMVNGKKKNICTENGLCSEFKDGFSSGCEKWVVKEEGVDCLNDLECLSGKCKEKKCVEIMSLNENNYSGRNISWEGLDYSGYSIANQYPIYSLNQKDYSKNSSAPIWKLAYKNQKEEDAISKSCRAYPEATSPFPISIASQDGFQNVNSCSQQETDNNACECSYRKVETTNYNTAYFNLNKTSIAGICSEGSPAKIGLSCNLNNDCCDKNDTNCIDDKKGQCSAIKKANTYYGWKGYCLEKDENTLTSGSDGEKACSTWFPVDLVSGEIDPSLNFPDAGFNPSSTDLGIAGNLSYCLEKTGAFEWRIIESHHDWKPKWFSIAGILPAAVDYLLGTSHDKFCSSGYYIRDDGIEDHWYWPQKKIKWSCVPWQGVGCYDLNTNQINKDFTSDTSCNNARICNTIAIVSGAKEGNKAWTDRIWQAQKYPTVKYQYNRIPLGEYSYVYDEGCKPFGALPGLSDMDKLIYISTECGKNATTGAYLGKIDYENKKENLKEIFVKAGAYSWGETITGTENTTLKTNVCDEKSYNAGAVCEKDVNCKPEEGVCEFNKNVCSNNLWQEITVDGEIEQRKIECNPLLTCKAGSECISERCNDGGNVCKNDDDCSNGCIGKCGNDVNINCKNDVDCNKICAVNTDCIPTGECKNKECVGKTCNSYSNCENVDGLQMCPDETTLIKANQNIKDCPLNEKGAFQTGSLHTVKNGICKKENVCTNLGAKELTTDCTKNSDCDSDKEDGLCISKDILVTTNIMGKEYVYNDAVSWDVTRGKVNSAPEIRAVDSLGCIVDKNWCPQITSKTNEFTINKQNSGDIAGEIGMSAVVKFYAWADKDQMPIRQIIIDWGDGSDKTITDNKNKIKNHKEKCEGNDFGDSPQACTETYFQFSHIYTRKGTFTPSISVKDNWGWCTNSYYAGDGECGTDGQIKYSGTIIIK